MQYVHFCPQFFQGITIVMNIINFEGGVQLNPLNPPWLRPCYRHALFAREDVYELAGTHIQSAQGWGYSCVTRADRVCGYKWSYIGAQLQGQRSHPLPTYSICNIMLNSPSNWLYV